MRAWFVISEIAAGFRRNVSMVSAVILVTFVSLSAVGSALLLQAQVDRLKGEWYGKAEVSIELCPVNDTGEGRCPGGGVSADQQAMVEDKLNSVEMSPYVSEFALETPAELFELLRSYRDKDWIKGITVDDLPALIHVKLKDPDSYPVVEEAVAGFPGVYKVSDQFKQLEPLFNILNKAEILALVVAFVLMAAAILLITTTIRLSAMSRHKETGIMRLVGASNLFIQLPFMLEGAIAALIGSLLSVACLWGVAKFWLAGWLSRSFGEFMSRINPGDVFAIAPWLVLTAVALGALSSMLTLRRFTKV